MNILEYVKSHPLYLDGGMGTVLISAGLKAGEAPERWNITRPEVIRGIHLDYFRAGSNVVSANTFGINADKYSADEAEAMLAGAFKCAKEARNMAEGDSPRYIALDIGPLGRMLEPYGDLPFEEAVELFAKTVRLGVKYGAELIFIETMTDAAECRAALLAAKENSSLPVFVSCAYDESGRLLTGATPLAMVAMLEGLGADAIGVNCGRGPEALMPVIDEYLKYASVPVLFKPNAGLPTVRGGKTEYDVSPAEFAEQMAIAHSRGVRISGGCCGTTPEYIKALTERTRDIPLLPLSVKNLTVVSSAQQAVVFEKEPVLIGERINPTGKKRFREALLSHDINYILDEALKQEECGVHILDVNLGHPEIDEVAMLREGVRAIQAVVPLPLQLDTSNPAAMESALRTYCGKAMINSVNGKRQSMEAVFPLAKKYGGLVVALTLDEDGIPESAEGRVEIARKILAVAAEYGISKNDIIFDPLALTVSADKNAAIETLRALRMLRDELGVKTSLGVSNVSFGLPKRDIITAEFFTLALAAGLSAAIMNPYSAEMMKAYHAYLALMGRDDNFSRYIAFAEGLSDEVSYTAGAKSTAADSATLGDAVIHGLAERSAELTRTALANGTEALMLVESEIIPALNKVGEGYEKGKIYLPGLLMSAEAASSAFAVIKEAATVSAAPKRTKILLATVKGDIHDIGKNIVKLLLENYGFPVTDLGRDVPPERVVAEVKKSGIALVGLSALMTTTTPAMAETVALLRAECPAVRIVVGGAVLTREYAEKIGADCYARDAMETVRYAELIEKLKIELINKSAKEKTMTTDNENNNEAVGGEDESLTEKMIKEATSAEPIPSLIDSVKATISDPSSGFEAFTPEPQAPMKTKLSDKNKEVDEYLRRLDEESAKGLKLSEMLIERGLDVFKIDADKCVFCHGRLHFITRSCTVCGKEHGKIIREIKKVRKELIKIKQTIGIKITLNMPKSSSDNEIKSDINKKIKQMRKRQVQIQAQLNIYKKRMIKKLSKGASLYARCNKRYEFILNFYDENK